MHLLFTELADERSEQAAPPPDLQPSPAGAVDWCRPINEWAAAAVKKIYCITSGCTESMTLLSSCVGRVLGYYLFNLLVYSSRKALTQSTTGYGFCQ